MDPLIWTTALAVGAIAWSLYLLGRLGARRDARPSPSEEDRAPSSPEDPAEERRPDSAFPLPIPTPFTGGLSEEMDRAVPPTLEAPQTPSYEESPETGEFYRSLFQKDLEGNLNAQRMEAVGRLAGGIAHDFNNLLTTISGHADLLMMEPAASEPIRADVARIKRAADQAGILVRQLLAFSRRQVLKSRVMDLNQTVEGVVDMVDRLIGEDIEVITVPGGSLWNVWADPGQMDQVLLNLMVNARDAMPHGGTLTVRTRNLDLPGSGGGDSSLEPGQYVVLEVSDTGTGIPEADLPRVFEPFFTTKDPGKGTGLGLAMSYGIVKQSGGQLEVDSEPGRGATFRIVLPRASGKSKAVGATEAGMSAPTGSETILVVEDEGMVRRLSRRVLERQGYTVLEAEDGSEAIRVAEEWVGPIQLLFTDLGLPDIDGRALARHFSQLRPEMAYLYTSGYSREGEAGESFQGPPGAFLQKPFGPVELARQVRELLDEGSEGRPRQSSGRP